MSEKENNPLKRGRVQGKALAPKKKSLVGEISDPSSVLSDSIATKGRNESPSTGDYIPSENTERVKTTTVDPLADPTEDTNLVEKGRNSDPYHRSNRSKEGRKFDTNRREFKHNDKGWKGGHSSGYSSAESKNPTCTCATGESEPCSAKCCIKRFFCRILKFLGFKSSCSHQCGTVEKRTRSLSNANRYHSPDGEGTRNGNRHRGRHHHSKTSPKKF
jgi:hypothetical protein